MRDLKEELTSSVENITKLREADREKFESKEKSYKNLQLESIEKIAEINGKNSDIERLNSQIENLNEKNESYHDRQLELINKNEVLDKEIKLINDELSYLKSKEAVKETVYIQTDERVMIDVEIETDRKKEEGSSVQTEDRGCIHVKSCVCIKGRSKRDSSQRVKTDVIPGERPKIKLAQPQWPTKKLSSPLKESLLETGSSSKFSTQETINILPTKTSLLDTTNPLSSKMSLLDTTNPFENLQPPALLSENVLHHNPLAFASQQPPASIKEESPVLKSEEDEDIDDLLDLENLSGTALLKPRPCQPGPKRRVRQLAQPRALKPLSHVTEPKEDAGSHVTSSGSTKRLSMQPEDGAPSTKRTCFKEEDSAPIIAGIFIVMLYF